MTAANADIHPTACPRCRSGTLQLLAKSPDAGVWMVFGCSTCFYAWRSTEPEENVNPEKYPSVKKEDGQAFVDWLISAEGQAAIAGYEINGQQLFFPNADKKGS